MNKIIIAIDGYSSCGKSTFAKSIAAKLKYIFIDTGAMYRAVTLYAMREGLLDDMDELTRRLGDINISFRYNAERGASDVYIGEENCEQAIRTIEVSNNVSSVSQVVQVREYLVAMQQCLGEKKGVVMDGRDIGTVVFPNAELKIFMTADPEVRVMRRYLELSLKGEKVSLEEITKNITDRDNADMTREISPLRKADDALVLDNSNMSVDHQMLWVMEKINKLIK